MQAHWHRSGEILSTATGDWKHATYNITRVCG